MIEFKNVVKKFGTRVVLNKINLRIEPGEIVFVIGKSGVGKSVLLKHIVGLLTADAGEVLVNGANVATLTEEAMLVIRRECGMVFQSPALLDSLSVGDNVGFGLRASGMGARAMAAEVRKRVGQVGLSEAILPRFPSELSFGEQKRVSIARTLAVEPKYLLFDEPTTGLDPVATRTLNTLIQRLSRELKVAALVVSHDMAGAMEIADRIIMLGDGKIIDEGTAAHMKNSEVKLVREFLREVLL